MPVFSFSYVAKWTRGFDRIEVERNSVFEELDETAAWRRFWRNRRGSASVKILEVQQDGAPTWTWDYGRLDGTVPSKSVERHSKLPVWSDADKVRKWLAKSPNRGVFRDDCFILVKDKNSGQEPSHQALVPSSLIRDLVLDGTLRRINVLYQTYWFYEQEPAPVRLRQMEAA